MKSVRPILEAALAFIALRPTAYAKCPVDIVTVQGSIADSGGGAMEVTVVAHTPKGDFSGKVDVAGANFRVDVPFNTLKSWSPLLGHKCTNVPETIDVKLSREGRLVSEKQLKFKDNFETIDSVTYRLKHQLTLEPAKK